MSRRTQMRASKGTEITSTRQSDRAGRGGAGDRLRGETVVGADGAWPLDERLRATRRAEGRKQRPGSTSGTRFSPGARLSEPPSGTRAMPRYAARRRPSSPAVCTAAGGRSWPVRRLSHRTARGSLRLAAASGTEGKLTTTARRGASRHPRPSQSSPVVDGAVGEPVVREVGTLIRIPAGRIQMQFDTEAGLVSRVQ